MNTQFDQVADGTLKGWSAARRRVLRNNAGHAAVHAWRIRSRQLFALEELLAPNPHSRHGTLRLALHEAFDASGNLRDTQLEIQRLTLLVPAYSSARRLARHLRHRLPRQRQRVVDLLQAVKPRQVRRIVMNWSEPGTAVSGQSAADRAVRRLRRAAQLSHARRGEPHTSRSLHRRRIHLKLLRYMIELCLAAGSHPGGLRWTLPQLTALQSSLGAITDIQVVLKAVNKYGRRHRRWRIQASPLRRHLRQQRQLLLDPLR